MATTYPVISPDAARTASSFGMTLLDDANAAAARTTLGLVIGTDVAAQSSLASYLPLAGGTLTGPIAGTSGLVELRNGSTAQRLQVAITDDGGSNYARTYIARSPGDASIIYIDAESGGTGSVTELHFGNKAPQAILDGATYTVFKVNNNRVGYFDSGSYHLDVPMVYSSVAASVITIPSGSNARAGNATLVAGTIAVAVSSVTANSIVMLTRKTSGGTIGMAITYTLNAGTGFTINSDNILDTSVFSYLVIENT